MSDIWQDIKKAGVQETWNERSMWNQMRMSETDIGADVTGYTYTYLMNGVTDDGWVGLFKARGKSAFAVY